MSTIKAREGEMGRAGSVTARGRCGERHRKLGNVRTCNWIMVVVVAINAIRG